MEEDFLMTIVMCGRNDNFAGNFVQRLEHNLNKLIDNIEKLNLNDIEIIVTDWGSPEDKKLYDIINLSKRDYLKFLYVPKELTKRYSPDSNFSIPHAMNAAVRRMNGKYMLSLDGDSYVPFDMFEKVYNLVKNNNRDYIYYWGSRYLMPYHVQTTVNNIQEMDNLIEDWKSKGMPLVHHTQLSQGWALSRVDLQNFGGGGCAILINKEIVQEANFLYEKLTKWGWMDIEFHKRIISRYECLGDLIYTLDAHFYHIGHHENQAGQNVHGFNTNFVSQTFNANGDNWGLGNENLKFNNE
jgi:hypothetical protein